MQHDRRPRSTKQHAFSLSLGSSSRTAMIGLGAPWHGLSALYGSYVPEAPLARTLGGYGTLLSGLLPGALPLPRRAPLPPRARLGAARSRENSGGGSYEGQPGAPAGAPAGTWTVRLLKEALLQRQLPRTGRKQDLLDRLQTALDIEKMTVTKLKAQLAEQGEHPHDSPHVNTQNTVKLRTLRKCRPYLLSCLVSRGLETKGLKAELVKRLTFSLLSRGHGGHGRQRRRQPEQKTATTPSARPRQSTTAALAPRPLTASSELEMLSSSGSWFPGRVRVVMAFGVFVETSSGWGMIPAEELPQEFTSAQRRRVAVDPSAFSLDEPVEVPWQMGRYSLQFDFAVVRLRMAVQTCHTQTHKHHGDILHQEAPLTLAQHPRHLLRLSRSRSLCLRRCLSVSRSLHLSLILSLAVWLLVCDTLPTVQSRLHCAHVDCTIYPVLMTCWHAVYVCMYVCIQGRTDGGKSLTEGPLPLRPKFAEGGGGVCEQNWVYLEAALLCFQ